MIQEFTTFYDIEQPEVEIDSINKILNFDIGETVEIEVLNKDKSFWNVDTICKTYKVLKIKTNIKKFYKSRSLPYQDQVDIYIYKSIFLKEA